MAKVFLPLASGEAHGVFMGTIVYCGTTVRVYEVPTDPRTEQQLNVRKFFYDVSKTLKQVGLWGRSALKTDFGSNWCAAVYQYLAMNGGQVRSELLVEWEALTAGQRQMWRDHAPYLATFNDPGEVFFVLAMGIARYFDQYGSNYWELQSYDNYIYQNAGDWWARDLAGVAGKGDSDDGNAAIEYSTDWTVQTHASAFGGEWHRAPSGSQTALHFYFKGDRVELHLVRGVGFAQVMVQVGDWSELVSLSADALDFSYSIECPSMGEGLHFCTVGCAGVQNYWGLDYVTVKSKVRAKASTLPDTSTVTGAFLELTEQAQQPTAPAANKDKLYFGTDGKFYKLDDSGTPAEVGAGGLTEEQANALYALIVHNHSGVYSPVGHDHNGVYSPVGHDHSGVYSPVGHDHSGVYSPVGHTHKYYGVMGTHLLGATVPASTTYYTCPWKAALNSTANGCQWPIAGTLKNLAFGVGAQPASGSLVVTVLVNGNSTSIVATCPAGQNGTFTDTTHSQAINAGDAISFRVDNNATGISGSFGAITLSIERDAH